jgi:hypothetical protein
MLTLQYIIDNSFNQALTNAVASTPLIVEKQIKSIEKLLSFLCVDRYMALWVPNCQTKCKCSNTNNVVSYPSDIQDLILYLLEQKYYTTVVPWTEDCTLCYDPNVQSMSMPWGFGIVYREDKTFSSYYKTVWWISIPSDYYRILQKYDCKNLFMCWTSNV